MNDEVHPLLAEDPSRYRRDAGSDHRNADSHRPGTGGRGGSRRRPRPVPHRARDRGGAAPECRPPARVHDRHRQRHRARGLRGAECAHRHERCLRLARHVHSRHRHHAAGRRNPRRPLGRYAGVRARAGSRRGPRWHPRSARRCAGRRALRAMGGSRRSGDRYQRHAEPWRLLCRARHRARSGRCRHRHAEAVATGEVGARVPRRPALANRLAGGVPVDSRPHHSATCATGRARHGCKSG